MVDLDNIAFTLSVVPWKFAGSHLQSTLTPKIIQLCIQRIQEKATPQFLNPQHVPMLAKIARCCYELLEIESNTSCTKELRMRVVEAILLLLPFPDAHFDRDLVS
jgi:hypothetical protein